MAQLRGLMWWTDRWKTSRAYLELTLEEQGAYRNLLDEAFRLDGVLPNDERVLALCCGDPISWPRIREKVLRWFVLQEDGWHNETLDQVLRESNRRADKQAEYRKRISNPHGNGSGNGDGNDAGYLYLYLDKEQKQEETEDLVDVPPEPPTIPPAAENARESSRKAKEAERLAEVAWRVSEVWKAHLAQREYYWREQRGSNPPGKAPTLTDELRKHIREALKRHDGELLAAEDRERWIRESQVRAAGIGLFLDPWCNGTDERNSLHNGGKPYLEPWRPWMKQRGKPDPVPRFAELYWETKQ